MNALTLEIYEIFKKQLGESGATKIVTYIEDGKEIAFERKMECLATKDDINALNVKFSDNKSEIIKWMFIFWIGQVFVIGWLIVTLFKLT